MVGSIVAMGLGFAGVSVAVGRDVVGVSVAVALVVAGVSVAVGRDVAWSPPEQASAAMASIADTIIAVICFMVVKFVGLRFPGLSLKDARWRPLFFVRRCAALSAVAFPPYSTVLSPALARVSLLCRSGSRRRMMPSQNPPAGADAVQFAWTGAPAFAPSPALRLMPLFPLPGFRIRRFQFSLQRLPVAFLADHQGLAVYDRPFASPSMPATDFTRQHTLFSAVSQSVLIASAQPFRNFLPCRPAQ